MHCSALEHLSANPVRNERLSPHIETHNKQTQTPWSSDAMPFDQNGNEVESCGDGCISVRFAKDSGKEVAVTAIPATLCGLGCGGYASLQRNGVCDRCVREKGLEELFPLLEIGTEAGSDAPAVRSASVLVQAEDGALLVFGGETQPSSSTRHERVVDDVWSLGPPTAGWEACSCPTPKWVKWACGATANESVPTARSNHAAVACGEHLLVFGGWAADGNTPLSHPELLHLVSRVWTHCSTTNAPPSPRGNATLVYSQKRHLVILYGGWDRTTRLGDLHCLDMESWTWHEAATEAADGHAQPAPRTDHTAVLWRVDGTRELMLVFGGSTCRAGRIQTHTHRPA